MLGSFAFARGSQPFIIGMPGNSIDITLLNAQKQREATQKLLRIMRSRKPTILMSNSIWPNDEVLVYYRSSKQSERDEWIQRTIVSVNEHSIQVRVSRSGRPLEVAYEGIRFIPKRELSAQLVDWIVEDVLRLTQHRNIPRHPYGQELQVGPGSD